MSRPRIAIVIGVIVLDLLFVFTLMHPSTREYVRGFVGLSIHELAPTLSGIGTVLVASANIIIVVIGLNLWPDRPELKLTVETQTDAERLSDRIAQSGQRTRIRLKVQNCSKKVTARNCIAKIEFERRNGKKPMEISSLHWNRLYYPIDLVEFKMERAFWARATASIDIRPGEVELLDVIFAPIWGEDAPDAQVEEKRAQVFTGNWMISRWKGIDQLEPGSYDVKVTVYSDNGGPKPTKIRLEYARDSDLKATQIE